MTANGDHDAVGVGYLWRRMGPHQAIACAEAHRQGVPVLTLAREYGVSRRTIYRAIERAPQRIVGVRVEDWHADFAITDDGPVRMTAWHANP